MHRCAYKMAFFVVQNNEGRSVDRNTDLLVYDIRRRATYRRWTDEGIIIACAPSPACGRRGAPVACYFSFGICVHAIVRAGRDGAFAVATAFGLGNLSSASWVYCQVRSKPNAA